MGLNKKKEEKENEENNINNIKEDKKEDDKEKPEKEDKGKGDENIDEDPVNQAYHLYDKNKRRIMALNIKYFFAMTVVTFTKLYWLVLFLATGIMYTSQDLSAGIIIYIFIFGITFIRMFYPIIMKLSSFMKQQTYLLSKVIRNQLIEREGHFRNLKQHRDKSFHYLLGFSLLLVFLFYLYGVFDLFQNGCNPDLWKN